MSNVCVFQKKVVTLHDFCTQGNENSYATKQMDNDMQAPAVGDARDASLLIHRGDRRRAWWT